MKIPKNVTVLFYIASVIFYLTAILNFVNENSTDTGFVWLGLGSAFFCLGSALNALKMKAQKDNDNRNK